MTTNSIRRREIVASLRDKASRDALVAAEINTTLPFQIRACRKARGWSQTELARRTGQAQKTISDFENPSYGRLTLTSLKKLASALDVALAVRLVPFSELVDWIVSMSSERVAVAPYDEDKRLALGRDTVVHQTSADVGAVHSSSMFDALDEIDESAGHTDVRVESTGGPGVIKGIEAVCQDSMQ